MRTPLILCALAGTGLASGLDVPAIGSSFSNPAVADAAAVYWNPALLARIERPTLSLGLGFVGGRVAYQRERRGNYQFADNFDFGEPVDPDDIDPDRTGKAAEVTAPIALPTGDLFLAWPVADRVALGFGIYSPYAAPIEWPDDGAQRFALRQAFIAFTHVSTGLGVQITEQFYFGGSVSYVNGIAGLSQVQDFAAVDEFGDGLGRPPADQPNDFGLDAPSTVRELDVLARPINITDGTYHGATFNLGVAFAPTPDWLVGVTYDHGYEATFEGEFTLDMNDELFTEDLAQLGLSYDPLVEGDATLSFDLPKRVMFGAAYAATAALGLALRLEWVQWSTLEAFRVTLKSPGLVQPELDLPDTSAVVLPREWQDAYHVEFGGRYALDEDLGVSAALGYQSSASPDKTVDAASPDGHRLIGVAGVDWALSPDATLKVDAELQGILPRTVTTSRHDLGNGTYNLLVAAVIAHLDINFGGDDD